MIAASFTPFARTPLRSAVLIWSSVHEPMPVSLSCVMFEAVTLNGGSSQDSPLERSRSKIGAPRSPFGVWQFWQVMMVLTRYLPRSTGACASAQPVVGRAAALGVAGLEHAGVAAIARGIARPEYIEQFLHHRRIAQLGGRLAARMQVAPFGERDQLLDDRTQVLRLRQRGDDLLVLDQ